MNAFFGDSLSARALRCAAFVAILIAASSSLAANFRIGIGAGYGFGAGKDFLNGDQIPTSFENDQLFGSGVQYTEAYSSLGNGIKFDLQASWMFKETMGLQFASGVSFLGGFKITDEVISMAFGSLTTERISSSYIPVILSLYMRAPTFSMGIEPYVHFGPALLFPFTHGEVSGGESEEVEATSEYSFTPAVGFSMGVGVTFPVSDWICVNAEAAPLYAFAYLKEIATTDKSDNVTSKVVYVDDKATLPADVYGLDPTTYERGRPVCSFSSVALKLMATFLVPRPVKADQEQQ